jgi:hypothetical protein
LVELLPLARLTGRDASAPTGMYPARSLVEASGQAALRAEGALATAAGGDDEPCGEAPMTGRVGTVLRWPEVLG